MNRKRSLILVFFTASMLLLIDAAFAQSGRRGTRTPAPPAVTALPPSTAAIKPSGQVISLLAAGEIVHKYTYFNSSYLDEALKEFMTKMKQPPRSIMDIQKGGSMKLNEAKERAAKEPNAHLVWISYVTTIDGLGEMRPGHVDYAVLLPRGQLPF